jgi:hypothetical protein
MKFLVDECLSPELVHLAHERGHGESSRVLWIGKAGAKDWELMPLIQDGDWTFVTRNSYDFRGPAHTPGTKGLYGKTDLHAGLVCLNGPAGLDLDMQLELFCVALDELAGGDDLVNQALEITLEDDVSDIVVRRYELPVSE